MRFGQYELLERVAVGGMAEVYRGRAAGAEGFEKWVAIKRILPEFARDERFVSMLLTEAGIHSALSHRNIVQIHDLGISEDGEYFIVLEYVEGHDLRAVTDAAVQAGMCIPDAVALHIADELAQALHFAHELRGADGQPLGLVHRDVSPSNVLISNSGEVKLSDFGLAKRRHDHSVVGSLKGNLAYMSPEQARGAPLDRRSDVFSLGAVLFEMLTGSKLREITDEVKGWREVASGVVRSARTVRSDLPESYDKLLRQALAAELGERFPDGAALGAAIRELRREMEVPVGPAEVQALLRQLDPPRRARSQVEISKVIRLGHEFRLMAPAAATKQIGLALPPGGPPRLPPAPGVTPAPPIIKPAEQQRPTPPPAKAAPDPGATPPPPLAAVPAQPQAVAAATRAATTPAPRSAAPAAAPLVGEPEPEIPGGISQQEIDEAIAMPATPPPELAAAAPPGPTEQATPAPAAAAPLGSAPSGWQQPAHHPHANGVGLGAAAPEAITPPPTSAPSAPAPFGAAPAVAVAPAPAVDAGYQQTAAAVHMAVPTSGRRSVPNLALVGGSVTATPVITRMPRRSSPWRSVVVAFFAVLLLAALAVHLAFIPLDVLVVWRRPAWLWISSEPPGARVDLDGELLPDSTPMRVQVQRDQREHVVELSQTGWLPARKVVRYDREVTLSHTLPMTADPTPPKPPEVPPAEPTPAVPPPAAPAPQAATDTRPAAETAPSGGGRQASATKRPARHRSATGKHGARKKAAAAKSRAAKRARGKR